MLPRCYSSILSDLHVIAVADEQGLGKTVQMLALIVSNGPTVAEARSALRNAQHSHESMQAHPLGSAARAARAAQLGLSPDAVPTFRSSPGSYGALCSLLTHRFSACLSIAECHRESALFTVSTSVYAMFDKRAVS